MDRYGVIGRPISHSLSPRIHQSFAAQTGQTLRYEAIEIAPDELEDFLQRTELIGFNVTLPHKRRVFELIDKVSERADAAAAVNTVYRLPDGRLAGDNTDGEGFVTDISRHLALRGQRVLLLGAGGAAWGIAAPLKKAGLRELVIANRTHSKARKLAQSVEATAITWEELAQHGPFDGVIHSTAAGHQQMPDLPLCLVKEESWCYDLSYGKAALPFLAWARNQGCQAMDGLGMLVEQAALSFALWRGVQPKTKPILAELRTERGA